MLALGSCHPACKREAMYLRSLEVFFIKIISIIITVIVFFDDHHYHHNHQHYPLPHHYDQHFQGFVAAAGQVVLSLVVLSRGVLIHR